MTDQKPYRVVQDIPGCKSCGHGALWTIEGPDGNSLGASWGDAEFTQDLADYLNEAHATGHDAALAVLASALTKVLTPKSVTSLETVITKALTT